MADPLNPDEARQRFLAVTQGRRPADPTLDIATAKARLRQADPGLDIGPALRLLGEGRWRPALLSLMPWLLGESGRAWFAPLLLQLVEGFHVVLALVRRQSKQAASGQAQTSSPSGE